MMDESARRLLEENLRLTKENNRLLRKMRRAAAVGLVFRILWIAILIGVPVALYIYVIEPYYQGLQADIKTFQEQAETLQEQVGNVPGLDALLQFGSGN